MPQNCDQDLEILHAAQLLKQGELVAIPTETVYGLAADAKNPSAINKIFALKGRPANHPLIVHISGADQLTQWAMDIPDIAYRLAEKFWPGPLTLILHKHKDVPVEVTGGQQTIGLRCPNNALTLALLKQFDGGLAAPSANRFGHISPTTAQHVLDEFGEHAPMVLDGGACEIGIESTIVDLSQTPARILRPGQISFAQLQPFLADLRIGAQESSPRVSGDMAAHYAPHTPLRWLSREQMVLVAGQQKTVVLCLDNVPSGLSGLALPNNAYAYAQQLYASLRLLDQQNAELILLEDIPQTADWLAISDRLSRAIVGSRENNNL
jgi:L-threonylcarbamoyladenylate synthase